MRALVLATALTVFPIALVAAPAAAQERPWSDDPRFRFGVDAGTGLAWDAEGTVGGAIHAGIRAGVQLDEFFALYYQGRITGHGTEIERRRTVWLATTSNGLGFDVTLLSAVQIGGGLAVDYLTGDFCGAQLCMGANEGTYLGIDLRLAFIALWFQDPMSGQRNGLLIGARWHTTTLPDRPTSTLGAIHSLTVDAGWELF